MCETSKEYIQSFIVDINKEINWNYLKSNRSLKKKINDIVFQIDFYSSKFNDINSRVEVRSECRVWCRAYDKSLDETLGREEALHAANQYADNFTETEAAILERYVRGECDLINEKNLRYMIVNHFVTI